MQPYISYYSILEQALILINAYYELLKFNLVLSKYFILYLVLKSPIFHFSFKKKRKFLCEGFCCCCTLLKWYAPSQDL